MELLIAYGPVKVDQLQVDWGDTGCLVLSFLDNSSERALLDHINASRPEGCSVIRASELLDPASRAARDKFSKFIARWPAQVLAGRRTFKEMFTYKGELSTWWLGSASAKETEVYKSFDYLCHLEVIALVLRQEQFTGCTLIGTDLTMVSLVAGLCQRESVDFRSVATSTDRMPGPSYLGALARRLALVGRTLAQMLVFTMRRGIPEPSDKGAATGFVSLYPGPLELRDGRPYDRMYRDVIPALEEGGPHPLVLAWYQGRGLRSLVQGGDWAHQAQVVFLNRFLRLADIWFVLHSIWELARFAVLERTSRSYHNSFCYDDIDVYELLAPEFKAQFLSNEIPYHLLIARTVERAVRAIPIQQVVCFLELYPFARAVYYGAKKADPGITTIAYQHANITAMRLWYTYQPEEMLAQKEGGRFIGSMPIPDRYIFQGSVGMGIVQASGYPAERCYLTGSPRYDDLARRVQQSGQEPAVHHGASQQDKTQRILLSPSLGAEDALELIEAVAAACAGWDQWEVAIKLHPECHILPQVNRLLETHKLSRWRLAQEPVHDLILQSDVVVTNYSTTGDEAIALGTPVVCYSGLRPCMATFLDIPAAPIVHSSEEMARALESILYDQDYRRSYMSRRDELVEGSFYKLDGKATDRVVAVLRKDGAPVLTQVQTAERMH